MIIQTELNSYGCVYMPAMYVRTLDSQPKIMRRTDQGAYYVGFESLPKMILPIPKQKQFVGKRKSFIVIKVDAKLLAAFVSSRLVMNTITRGRNILPDNEPDVPALILANYVTMTFNSHPKLREIPSGRILRSEDLEWATDGMFSIMHEDYRLPDMPGVSWHMVASSALLSSYHQSVLELAAQAAGFAPDDVDRFLKGIHNVIRDKIAVAGSLGLDLFEITIPHLCKFTVTYDRNDNIKSKASSQIGRIWWDRSANLPTNLVAWKGGEERGNKQEESNSGGIVKKKRGRPPKNKDTDKR